MSNPVLDKKLHQNVSSQLQQLHHPPASLPINDETPIPLTNDLKQIGVDASHIVGSTLEELTQGSTHIRETKSKKLLRLLQEKATKLAHRLKYQSLWK